MEDMRLSPGGTAITERMLALCGFVRGARVADIGCGAGETVALLRGAHGLAAVGIDSDETLVAGLANPHILHGEAERLPFQEESMDGLLFECSLSKMRDADRVLGECARVLGPGGLLAVSDLYARGEPHVFDGALYRLESWDAIRAQIEGAGFSLRRFEDCSPALTQLWGEMIFAHGPEALYERLGADDGALRRTRCGYFLAVFERGR